MWEKLRNTVLYGNKQNFVTICEISSSHGSKYEAQNLLECIAMFLIEC
jgi:hypothetical protein